MVKQDSRQISKEGKVSKRIACAENELKRVTNKITTQSVGDFMKMKTALDAGYVQKTVRDLPLTMERIPVSMDNIIIL